MSRYRGGRVIGMCAVVMLVLGCDEAVEREGTSSEATVCRTVGTSWWNQGFMEQRGRFQVELAATPSGGNVDAVVGLSNGPATTWSSLAAIVRFNAQGFVDARAGSSYQAVQAWPYAAGQTYHVRFEIDLGTRTYSAWASHEPGSYGSWNQIAADYPFRTEQAAVDRLNTLASVVDQNTGPGSLQLCGIHVNAEIPGGCIAADGGGGFANHAVAPALGAMILDASARVSSASIDAVVGVARGSVDAYNDFAASTRFWTTGYLEARDGDAYRADAAIPYRPGVTYTFKFIVDLANKTYSVLVIDLASGAPATWLARGYRFRPQQATVTRLDHAATVVSSASGHIELCDSRSAGHLALRYAREGTYTVAPVGANGALVSDGSRSYRLDAGGTVLGTLPAGGAVASDAAGNLYVARNAGGGIIVDSYTPAFESRWSRAVTAVGSVERAGVTSTGRLLVVTSTGTERRIYWVATNGASSGLGHLGITGVVATGPTGYVITGPESDGVAMSSYRADGFVRWSRFFPGSFDVSAIAIAADGSVAFGGQHFEDINFGDRVIYAGSGEDGPRNAYLVALASTGALRFSADALGNTVNGVATNGTLIAAASRDFTQMPWLSTQVYETGGSIVRSWSEEGFGLGDHGEAVSVAMSPAGTVYLNLQVAPFYPAERRTWPFLVALAP